MRSPGTESGDTSEKGTPDVTKAKDSEEVRQGRVVKETAKKVPDNKPKIAEGRRSNKESLPTYYGGYKTGGGTYTLVENLLTRVEPTEQATSDFAKTDELFLNRFRIICKLRTGGFGQIYRALDEKLEQEVALKLEPIEENQPNMEGIVLMKFSKSNYCPAMYAKGRTKSFNFVVMQLLGKNLTELRRQCPLKPPRLSLNTTLRLVVDCIKAIESLHSIGFIHRDIKPSNFAMGGTSTDVNQLYMLDFGLARFYRKKDGSFRPPRNKVGFRGTVRYASLHSHDNEELSRRDDMWSMFYSYFEMLVGELPWILSNDRQVVAKAKRIHTPESLSRWIPEETTRFVTLTRQLLYESTPDYESIIESFESCKKRMNIKDDDHFDWQVNDCKVYRHWSVSEDCVIKSLK